MIGGCHNSKIGTVLLHKGCTNRMEPKDFILLFFGSHTYSVRPSSSFPPPSHLTISLNTMARIIVLLATTAVALSGFLGVHAQPTGSSSVANKPRVIAYWPDWASNELHKFPYEHLDELIYAFGETDCQQSIENFNQDNLRATIERGRQKGHNTKYSLAIGGWSGSTCFSPNVASEANRTKFINTLVTAVGYFQLDGLNIDWEFPGSPDGMSCNIVSRNDTANFLVFLQELRAALDKAYAPRHNISITAAVGVQPFLDEKGNPLKDASAFAKVLDAVYIMAFDLAGNWDTKLGPNSPLYTSPQAEEQFSLDSGVKAWRAAGFSNEQIVAGVPFYGWSASGITNDIGKTGDMYINFKGLPQAPGDEDDAPSSDPCPNAKPVYSGTWTFSNLLSQGVLRNPTTANNQNGWVRNWDKGSQTPFLFNKEKGQFITYNDPTALRLKVNYVKENKLGGIFAWSLDQDTTDNLLIKTLLTVKN